LYSILIEFGVPLKLISLIKMCLNETHGKVRIGNVTQLNAPDGGSMFLRNMLKVRLFSSFLFTKNDVVHLEWP
jgi:hypothetical protein